MRHKAGMNGNGAMTSVNSESNKKKHKVTLVQQALLYMHSFGSMLS
jgi:hypothetical protein